MTKLLEQAIARLRQLPEPMQDSAADADVVALDRTNEGFGHSITLRTFDRRCSRFKADVASEATSVASDVTTAVVGEPFDGQRQTIDPTEPMLNGSHHQVTHILAFDPACGGEETHSLAITAVQCKGNPHLLTVVATDLEAVGAPAPIAFINRNAAVMAPLDAACVAIEEQAMDPHGAVDPLVIGRSLPGGQRLALEDGVDTPVFDGLNWIRVHQFRQLQYFRYNPPGVVSIE